MGLPYYIKQVLLLYTSLFLPVVTLIYTQYDTRVPFWNDLTALVSGSLVLRADQDLLLLYVKTAVVTWQPGQSGSSSLWALDRLAEPHDGWALSISRLHLWPVPDYNWRLLYSLLSSALHAPLTPHSERAAGIKPSQHQREGWSWEVGEEKMKWRGGFFFFF